MPPQDKQQPDFIPDSSPDFIPDSPMPVPDAHIGAAPGGIKNWLNSAENDIRYGSDTTMPGKILSFMGARGLNRGVNEATADQIGGPILGPINAAKGITSMGRHPIEGALQAAGGAIQTAGPFLGMGAPEAAELPEIMSGKIGGIADAANDIRNATARMTRYPATARQSELGMPGSIKLPPAIRRYIPDFITPKGELGTATNPGVFAKIPTRTPIPDGISSIAERDATKLNVPFAGEEAEPAIAKASQDMPRPLRPVVGTPEEWQTYEDQMRRLKTEASDAGTYSAARGKTGKKLNYQERIGKRISD